MIKVRSLSYRYPRSKSLVLNDVTFDLEKGKVGVLLGPNGAGKSTLIKLLLGFYKPVSGEILIQDKPAKGMGPNEKAALLAYVPQSLALPPLSVFETILLGRLKDFKTSPGAKDKEAAMEAARKLGIESLLEKKSDELSGGEKQKVALARAFAQGSEVLLFDEPTSNLDIASRKLTLNLAKLAASEGKTVLLAIHDLNDGLSLGDCFFLLKSGQLLASGKEEIITENNIYSLYGVKCHIEKIKKQKTIIWED